jgi:hypothetical protein|tara:strand:- start:314 stop:769 length:456 start_codon:yes stop_codon:yes gene_type:complete
MSDRLRLFLGVTLLVLGLFWDKIPDLIPEFPDANPVATLEIEKPSDELISVWSETAQSISEPKDRISLCVFNKVFADRVVQYEASAQQINDAYVLAAKEVFQDSLKGKYAMLATTTEDVMVSILGKENHAIMEDEKRKLNKAFMAFAWCLK